VQDKTETFAYFNKPEKNFIEERIFDGKFHFSPKIIKSTDYAKVVCNAMSQRLQGKKLIVQGSEAKNSLYADYDK
jgi:hypothetical protein